MARGRRVEVERPRPRGRRSVTPLHGRRVPGPVARNRRRLNPQFDLAVTRSQSLRKRERAERLRNRRKRQKRKFQKNFSSLPIETEDPKKDLIGNESYLKGRITNFKRIMTFTGCLNEKILALQKLEEVVSKRWHTIRRLRVPAELVRIREFKYHQLDQFFLLLDGVRESCVEIEKIKADQQREIRAEMGRVRGRCCNFCLNGIDEDTHTSLSESFRTLEERFESLHTRCPSL